MNQQKPTSLKTRPLCSPWESDALILVTHLFGRLEEPPFMLDSNGNIIEMTVKDYIPYVSVDQEKIKLRSSCVEKIMAVLDD